MGFIIRNVRGYDYFVYRPEEIILQKLSPQEAKRLKELPKDIRDRLGKELLNKADGGEI